MSLCPWVDTMGGPGGIFIRSAIVVANACMALLPRARQTERQNQQPVLIGCISMKKMKMDVLTMKMMTRWWSVLRNVHRPREPSQPDTDY